LARVELSLGSSGISVLGFAAAAGQSETVLEENRTFSICVAH
jgi:hypothetical protein